MKRGLTALAIAAVILLAGLMLRMHLTHRHFAGKVTPMTHAKSEFTVTVHAPAAVAFPLFGPEGERPWAGPHWDPQFLYPKPAKDIEGAVFRVHHGHHDATWVNTVFNAQSGHAAYVYIIAGKLATRIDVQLTPIDAGNTSVRVMYERTALDPSVEEDVGEMAVTDPQMGPDWEKSIADYLAKR
jgi:hypothetical protein